MIAGQRMTRAQYIAMWMIGALSLVAYLQSREVALAMQRSGAVRLPQKFPA